MSADSSQIAPPMNHVFLDYENVPRIDLSVIGKKSMSFTLFLGPKQTKLNTELVEKLMEQAASVQLVRLAKSGRNALDFLLVYYLGRAVLADPTAHFHIVSKDTDFEPVIEHLRSRHVQIRRHKDFSTLSFAAPSKAPGATDQNDAVKAEESALEKVLKNLRRNSSNRPTKKKKLLSHLKSHLGKKATEEDAERVLGQLIQQKHIEVDEKENVSYRL
jgi:hypothetical protein